MLFENRLDFAQLDTIASNLDLVIHTPQKLDDRAFTGEVSGGVSRTVQTSPRFAAEWVGDKPLGRQGRAPEVTTG